MDGSLNAYLQPLNSPISQNTGGTPSYYFQNNTERNAINLTRIKNFSFSQGFGGTLILGGTANGNGVMLIKNSSGSTIITANNAGIEIDGGNILIENGNNATILDTTGIVSSNAFMQDVVTNATGYTTTNTIATDLPGSTLASFTLTRSARVLVTVTLQGRNDNYLNDDSTMQAIVNDSLSGVILSYYMTCYHRLTSISQDVSKNITGWSENTSSQIFTVSVVTDFIAGNHTLKLQYNVNGTGTAIVDIYQLSYIVLGT